MLNTTALFKSTWALVLAIFVSSSCLGQTTLLASVESSNPNLQRFDLFRPLAAIESEALLIETRRTLGDDDASVMHLNEVAFVSMRKADLDDAWVTIPLPEGISASNALEVELHRFFVHPPTITVGMTREDGFYEEEYVPELQTFQMKFQGEVVGTLVLMTDHVLGSFHHRGQQFDISQIENDLYTVVNFNQRQDLQPFECGADENSPLPSKKSKDPDPLPLKSGGGGCIEVAVDVDNYTYLTYNNMSQATDWALAQMAGVSAIYTQELNGLALLVTSYVHLWQSVDPMASYTNDAGGMLDSFRITWEGTPSLDAIQRDVTHLMSKRGNTGTGGIAWLGVNCSSYAYGFSSVMTSSTSTNINSYSWNLDVVSHELGHNFGANHTHWCGWPGGAIDNCYTSEGGCSNGPSVSAGTIMSYCHVTSTPKVLQFHPVVENNALIPGISSAGCYGPCEGWVAPECAITSITAGTQQACDPLSLTYTQQLVIEYEYAPASGWLVVNGEQKAISGSPQSVNLIGQPADGQNVNVSAYFSTDEGCALSQPNAYTRRDPCCGAFRLVYVDPSANILRIRNEADCPGDLSEWGLLAPSGYSPLSEVATQGQDMMVDPGATVQISWAEGLTGDWMMLFLPTDVLYDYVQWGNNAPADIYFLQYDELSTIWPGGGSVFVDALPPYTYTGTGGYGVENWSGQDVPCQITSIEVTTATACNPTSNTYDLSFSIDWVGTPETGGLTVNGQSFPVSGNSLDGLLTLPANGSWVNLFASFDDEPTCSSTLNNAYYGPASCSVCPADVNGNGAVEVSDVLMVLSEFGCASNCDTLTDLDGDSSITVSDVLAVLSAFGEPC